MSKESLLQNNLGGLQHIGIPVSDLDRSVEFYKRFGFKRVLTSKVEEKEGTVKVAMMQHEKLIIELYQLYGEELETLKSRSDGHVDHIAFNVKDIDKAFKEIKAAGFETIEDKPVFLDFWENGCKYFAIRGPGGEKLEFNEIL